MVATQQRPHMRLKTLNPRCTFGKLSRDGMLPVGPIQQMLPHGSVQSSLAAEMVIDRGLIRSGLSTDHFMSRLAEPLPAEDTAGSINDLASSLLTIASDAHGWILQVARA